MKDGSEDRKRVETMVMMIRQIFKLRKFFLSTFFLFWQELFDSCCFFESRSDPPSIFYPLRIQWCPFFSPSCVQSNRIKKKGSRGLRTREEQNNSYYSVRLKRAEEKLHPLCVSDAAAVDDDEGLWSVFPSHSQILARLSLVVSLSLQDPAYFYHSCYPTKNHRESRTFFSKILLLVSLIENNIFPAQFLLHCVATSFTFLIVWNSNLNINWI